MAITLNQFERSIVRSDFTLPQVDTESLDPGEQNILIMGMDSRLDQNGNALPDWMYDALQAGDADDGGYNANVLILLHIPADRSRAVGIAIPRDDYVDMVGVPGGASQAKIKEAYGRAMNARLNELSGEEGLSEKDAYQQARAAGRQAQIETVSHFLGDIRIDHFVEMTMGGFYSVAEAFAPIQVCLNHATSDTYSGANFAAGIQDLDARQAISFVRQRRDTGDGPDLTDLDRSRRQQAFLVSLADKIKQRSTLTNPKTIVSLMDVTKNYVAVDTRFDAIGFLSIAREAAENGVQFVTLPVENFDTIDGSSVNIVDVERVQGVVAAVLDGSYFNQAPATEDPEASTGETDPAADPEAVTPDPIPTPTESTPTTRRRRAHRRSPPTSLPTIPFRRARCPA
ncbi:LCP family protein [Leucobacter coleopterorum]|uniref:LCP family protein n=1 Tax=Leucobacter coleopterorum TaxID=2714933 RepID=A0ABX6K0M2_9MICO|nr:LCP family protein [Leucobacter coleopterorum]QIM18629.1 LCP family protein [Leucobacter coleopterorum]